MEDFSALAARIAVTVGLRGCIILTRDGLVVGSFPPADESSLQPAWLRFAGLGDPEKSFVEFGDELWVYLRRGPYAVFAIAEVSARPGVVMDQLNQLLLAAEEARSKREALKVPEVADAPKSKPRTSLHKEPRPARQRPSAEADILASPAASAQVVTPEEQAPADSGSGSSRSWIMGADEEAEQPAASEQSQPAASDRRSRPVSWILAPQEPSEPPASSRGARPLSWILSPQEEPAKEPEPGPVPGPKVADRPSAVSAPTPGDPPAPDPVPKAEEQPAVDATAASADQPAPDAPAASTDQPASEPEPSPEGQLPPVPAPQPEESPKADPEVDRVMLAQEFARLLEDSSDDQSD